MGEDFLFVIVSFGMIVMGLYFIFGRRGKLKPGQQMVEATIVDQVTQRESKNSDNPTQGTTVSTYPIYEYLVKGTTYRTRGTVAITVFSKDKYKIGNKEMVRVDPSRPERIYTEGEKNSMTVMGVFMVIFGVMGLIFLF